MADTNDTDPVLEIVRGIYKDLTGRSGLGLDNIDDETKAEMVTKWYGIVNRHFGQTTLLAPKDILEAVESGRCICVGTDVWCTHEGRCERPVSRGISDGYCGRCLSNALAEER